MASTPQTAARVEKEKVMKDILEPVMVVLLSASAVWHMIFGMFGKVQADRVEDLVSATLSVAIAGFIVVVSRRGNDGE